MLHKDIYKGNIFPHFKNITNSMNNSEYILFIYVIQYIKKVCDSFLHNEISCDFIIIMQQNFSYISLLNQLLNYINNNAAIKYITNC